MIAFAEKITKLIGWFYIPPIRRFVSFQTFLYAVCGGCNMLFNWVLYFVIYNFIIAKQDITIGPISILAHTTTFLIATSIYTYTGFWLNKYIVFTNSTSRTRAQLIRYVISVLGSIIITDLGRRFFIDIVGIYPTPSYVIVSCISVLYSYMMQKYFTFRRVA